MDSLHFNIYSADSRHATWIAYISTFTLRINVMLHEQPTRQHLLSTLLPCYMDSLNFNIYFADSRHTTWTAYISTITLHITGMLHIQHTYQHLFSTILSCYMYSLHFNIYIPDYLHATWTAYISSLTPRIPAMLHGRPTFQHLLCIFPTCYMNSLQCNMLHGHFNIFYVDSRHATWAANISTFNHKFPAMLHLTAYISTFTLQITYMLNGHPMFQHLLCRFPPYHMDSMQCNI